VNLTDGHEIALKSIYHGPVFNITEENDSFTIVKGDEEARLKIPHGFYSRSCEILRAAFLAISQTFKEDFQGKKVNLREPPSFWIDQSGSTNLKMSTKSEFFKMGGGSPLFEVLDCYSNTPDVNKIEIGDYPLKSTLECGFLYSDVVKDSIINNSYARLMTCVPLQSKKGYNFIECRNPDYKPLAVNSFTDLSFVIVNQNGEDIKFDHSSGCGSFYNPISSVEFPTILNLHVRRIQFN
jgi:hypothetical protein